MSYKNFVAPTSFFGNSIAKENFYSSNHFYNPASYQIESANWANMSAIQNFYSIFKQNNVAPPIC